MSVNAVANGSLPTRPMRIRATREAGFTILEVLIAFLVLAVGLAGLASLIITGIKANDSAIRRSEATLLAQDIIDRMRANRGRASVASTALGGGYSGGAANLLTLCKTGSRHPADGRTCTHGAAPTGTGTHLTDLAQWWNSLDNSGLPNWYAAIRRLPAGGTPLTNRFIVSVSWDDSRAKPDTPAITGGTQPTCYNPAVTMPAQMEQVCFTIDL